MSILNTIICLLLSSVLSSRLLVPEGASPANGWPAVLLLHDHGARFEKGWEKVIGPKPEPYYSGMAIGDSLVAEDTTVAVCIAAHWMTTPAQNRYNDSWLCMVRKDQQPFAQIAASIAPRPFLLQYGLQDKLFPVSAVDSCVRYIDSVYQMTNVQSQISNPAFLPEKHSCGHIFTHEHLKNWLIWLKMHL